MTTATSPTSVEARVNAARTRITFGPVPSSSFTAAGLVIVLAVFMHQAHPDSLTSMAWLWLAMTFLASLGFACHALCYLKSADRHAAHWLPTHVGLTLVISACWAAGLWMLPLAANRELATAMLMCLLGVTTTGSSLLVGYKWLSRVWAIPPMVSLSAYLAWQHGGIQSAFWCVVCAGILALHWQNAARKEKHLKEMLRLRYANEDMVMARDHALSEARQLSEAKSQFLATMSHEMRTPIHGVLGLGGMLEQEPLSEAGRRNLRLLQGAAEHLLHVINDVLDFSKLRANKLALHPEETDVAELARSVSQLAEATARDKPVEVVLSLDLPEEGRWLVDRARLRQILLNLAGNAVKFTERGRVTLTVQHLGTMPQHPSMDRLQISVADTGIGIPPDEVQKIFDAFHQVGTRHTQGTGLGLPIARQLCEAMGAELLCESQVGHGSTFSFILTAVRCLQAGSPVCAPSHPAAPDGEMGLAHRRALVVDDNKVNLLISEAQLTQCGLSVHCTEGGRSALEWLRHHAVDVILMDCHMPDMDGFEAATQIRRQEQALGLARTPIVALTASSLDAVREHCLRSGMDHVMAKPCTAEQLMTVLRGLASPEQKAGERTGAPEARPHIGPVSGMFKVCPAGG